MSKNNAEWAHHHERLQQLLNSILERFSARPELSAITTEEIRAALQEAQDHLAVLHDTLARVGKDAR